MLEEGEECPAAEVTLIVHDTDDPNDIVSRRNYVLEQMKLHSVLSAGKYTADQYETAKSEPLILTPQEAAPWKAPHFVWQIRKQLGALLCGEENAETCEAVDTGGYKVITTLDWEMQQSVEKWLLASTRVTHRKNPTPVWEDLGIPKSEYGWLRNLSGANIHNGAAGVMDYRTGEVLAYGGSGGYYLEGTKKFQPQFDVLSDGFRQLGSAIKPLNYIVGIDDRVLTASTMFMDVVTDFGSKGSGGSFLPTQADGLERGPVRLRSALQFSFNIPAIKAGIEVGLEREFNKWKEFGLSYPPGAIPVVSQSVGAIETHPIEMLGAYGAIANGGELMPRTMILEVKDKDGATQYPTSEEPPVGKRVASDAGRLHHHRHPGREHRQVDQPDLGPWQILEKTGDGPVRRPAAYKTGTTNDRKDTAAFGFLAAPKDESEPALVVGVWMGNSDSTPNNDALSLGLGRAAVVADHDRDQPEHAHCEVQRSEAEGPGHEGGRRVQRPPARARDGSDGRGDVHQGHRADPPRQPPCQRPDRRGHRPPVAGRLHGPADLANVPRLQPGGARLPEVAAVHAGVGAAGGARRRCSRRAEAKPDDVLLQPELPPVRCDLGRPVQADRGLLGAGPVPAVEPTPSEPSNAGPCIPPEPTPTETNGEPTDPPDPTPTKGPKPTKGPGTTNATLGLPALLGGIPPAATVPLLVPLLGLLVGRRFRPARPPSRRHRPRRARPPGPS